MINKAQPPNFPPIIPEVARKKEDGLPGQSGTWFLISWCGSQSHVHTHNLPFHALPICMHPFSPTYHSLWGLGWFLFSIYTDEKYWNTTAAWLLLRTVTIPLTPRGWLRIRFQNPNDQALGSYLTADSLSTVNHRRDEKQLPGRDSPITESCVTLD